jgi:hypothetical protein
MTTDARYLFNVGAVASFLAVEFEARTQENRFKSFPMLGCELRHRCFCFYTSARTVRCSNPLHAGPRHSPRTLRYPASSRTWRRVPCLEAVERKSFTASSTVCRADSGESPELATSIGIAWATYWLSSCQICTVYCSFIRREHSHEHRREQDASLRNEANAG